MVPLHTNAKNYFFLLVLISFLACSDSSKTDLKVIQALNESIENSNRRINATTVDIMISLQDKLYDYPSKERAAVWFPKAQAVQKISKDVFGQIQAIKSKLETKEMNRLHEEDIGKIYESLINYKKEVLQIDEKMTKDYQKYLKIFTRSIDSSTRNQRQLFKEYFSSASATSSIAMLTKLQNNIKINEEGLVTYCNEHSIINICGFSSVPAPLVVQNSTIFKPGDQIEITAGLATMSFEQTPKIAIYNKTVSINETGFANQKFKVASKPGKYYVPVRITYTNQDGKQVEVNKEIEYRVANIVDQ